MRILVWCLLALIAQQEAFAIREFGGHQELRRPVRRWGRKGKTEEEKVTLDEMGRKGFDPEFTGSHVNDDHDDEDDVKKRLQEIFPLLDLNKDGFVDAEELWRWHADNNIRSLKRRNEVDFNRTDTNKDGLVSIVEYMNEVERDEDDDGDDDHDDHHDHQDDVHDDEDDHHYTDEDLSMENITEEADFDDWLATIKTAFKLADRDGDGQLNFQEYFEFQNPEESDNDKLKYHVIKQDIHLRDDDEDKELSFDEFHAGYWSSFFIWEEEREKFDEEKDQEKARMKFIELDTDGNNFLNAKELIAAFADLHPSERRYARLQSEHMMDMADENGDRKLTLKEALKNAHAFYSFTNDDDDYNYHDEL